MNELEINRLIDKEFDDFNKSVYVGDKLPADLMELFKKAIFKIAPTVFRASSETIKRLIKTKVDDLTNYEVGFVLNQISSVPLCDLYKDIFEALAKTKRMEELKLSYNIMIKNLNETMDKKKEQMLNLSGSQMKIISPAQA